MKRLIAYILFTSFLDAPNFQVTSDIEFHKSDYIYICKLISDKRPLPTSEPVQALGASSPDSLISSYHPPSHSSSLLVDAAFDAHPFHLAISTLDRNRDQEMSPAPIAICLVMLSRSVRSFLIAQEDTHSTLMHSVPSTKG